MCCCSELAACIQREHAQPHTTTHKAINTCIDSGATQSSQSRANPSIAGWLGSNHHSQQGQNERMADSLWRSPLSHKRLMTHIFGQFTRRPVSRQTYNKKSLISYSGWKNTPLHCVYSVYLFVYVALHFVTKTHVFQRKTIFPISIVKSPLGCVRSFVLFVP